MKLVFKIADLRLFLERQLGFGICSLRRLPGRSASLNFVAERVEDGLRFVVKCLPVASSERLSRLLRIDQDLQDAQFPVHRLFRERNDEFAGHRILYYEYCAGDSVSPADITPAWAADFAADYRRISNEFQSVSDPLAMQSLEKWYVWSTCEMKGMGASRLMHKVRSLVDPGNLVFEDSSQVVIHGDFHSGNLFFRHGRLSKAIDLENMCKGNPTEDMVRFFTSMIEHCGLFSWRHKAKVLQAFAVIMRELGCSRHEWLVAINRAVVVRVASRLYFQGVNPWTAFRELSKLRLYGKMKELVQS